MIFFCGNWRMIYCNRVLASNQFLVCYHWLKDTNKDNSKQHPGGCSTCLTAGDATRPQRYQQLQVISCTGLSIAAAISSLSQRSNFQASQYQHCLFSGGQGAMGGMIILHSPHITCSCQPTHTYPVTLLSTSVTRPAYLLTPQLQQNFHHCHHLQLCLFSIDKQSQWQTPQFASVNAPPTLTVWQVCSALISLIQTHINVAE